MLGFVAAAARRPARSASRSAARYLASPTWRLAVTVDDDGLDASASPKRAALPRSRGPTSSRSSRRRRRSTCFVDGGEPERSLLVPGDGAPAPYDIADRDALYEAILAHVPADKVQTVESLDKA